MNVLFICDEYPPGKNGGIGTAVQLLARGIVRSGQKAFVLGLYEYAYGQQDNEVDFGVKVWRLRYGMKFKEGSIFRKLFRKMPDFFKKYFYGKSTFDRFIDFVNKIIVSEKIDVIEIPDWNSFVFDIGFFGTWPDFNVPLVVKLHGSYTYFKKELNEPLLKKVYQMDKNLFMRADAIASVSLYTANKCREIYHANKEIEVLHNTVEICNTIPKRTAISNETIVFTGSLVKKKGIFQLLKAWVLVKEKLPNARLIILGKGRLDIIEKQINPSVRNSIIFKGHVTREEIFVELSQATLAVFPSYSETFGIMCIEAMSVGCPIIYTKRSCGPEIVTDGFNGLLVNPDDVPEIANAIITLATDSNMQKEFSSKGLETVASRFNIAKSVAQHLQFYSQVISIFKQKGT